MKDDTLHTLLLLMRQGDAMNILCKWKSFLCNSELVKMLTCLFSIINNLTLR